MVSLMDMLPVGVACTERQGSFADAPLGEAIPLLGARASEKRLKEFAAGRSCARSALRKLGVPVVPVGRGEKGEPLWPGEVVGSITHCDNYCAAAVGFRSTYESIGIDAEANAPLPAGVLELIAVPAEQAWLQRMDQAETHWDKVIFSIKESIFKAWYPVQNCFLDYRDAEVSINPREGSFEALIPQAGEGNFAGGLVMRGRYALDAKFILSAITIPA